MGQCPRGSSRVCTLERGASSRDAMPQHHHGTLMKVGNRWHAFYLFPQMPSGHCAILFLELPNSKRWGEQNPPPIFSTHLPEMVLPSQVLIQLLYELPLPFWLATLCAVPSSLFFIRFPPKDHSISKYTLCLESVAVWVGSSAWFLCGGGRPCGGILVVWLWCILRESCCLFQPYRL